MVTPLAKVIWSEGSVLTQHHLQQWDHYTQKNQAFYQQHITPDVWGITELNWQTASLAQGQLVLNNAAGILPGAYSFAALPHSLALSLQEFVEDRLYIYLCLPSQQSISDLAGYDAQYPLQQRAYYCEVSDCYDTRRTQTVCFAEYQWFLEVATQPPKQEIYCVIGSLIKQFNQYQLDNTFIYPSPLLGHNQPLQIFIKDLSLQLKALIDSSESFDHQLLASYAELISLKSDQYITVRELYYRLAKMVLALTLYYQQTQPELYYDHKQADQSFKKLKQYFDDCIQYLGEQQGCQYQLKQSQPNRWISSVLAAEDFNGVWLLQLTFKDPIDNKDQLIKCAALSDIDDQINLALSGLKLTLVKRNSRQQIYQIEQNSLLWDNLKKEKRLAVAVLQSLAISDCTLIIRKSACTLTD